MVGALPGCAPARLRRPRAASPSPQPPPVAPYLDTETQSLMAQAERVVFVVPFSHWDTDWHEAFPDYVQRSDGNILAAIRMAQRSPRFRYALEQVLFVQHFWDTYPEHRAALTEAVQARQLTFAWAGLVQPDTSLVAPAIQWRNLQMGQDWIAETFGPEYVPRTAWQSDAFGNSAAFPQFLGQTGIPYLFIGRSQFRCEPDAADCEPLPHAFCWRSPASPAAQPVQVAYLSYPMAWDAIHRLPTEAEQITALRGVVEAEFARTEARYILLAFRVEAVPALGFAAVDTMALADLAPAAAYEDGNAVTMANGLVTVTLDGERGGTFTHLALADGPNLVQAGADEVIFYEDTGDVYGARFGEVIARESQSRATLTLLASGPLIARAQAVFSLAGQVITKTMTLRAGEPLVEVALDIRALPDSSAILQTATTLHPTARTDDLGFLAFQHAVDNRPIAAGDITYRRKIFYPLTYWSDVTADGNGLTLITHGLQGLGGLDTLNLLLVRQVAGDGGEGVTDQVQHRLRYAYGPHTGTISSAAAGPAAYAFNQPLIATWRIGDEIQVLVPFTGQSLGFPADATAVPFPTTYSLIEAEGGLVADLYWRNGQVEALVLAYDPIAPASLVTAGRQTRLEGPSPPIVRIALERP